MPGERPNYFRQVFDAATSWLAEHLIELLIGAGALLVGRVAWATAALKPYGTLGWIAVALATFVILSLVHALYAWATHQMADRDLKQSFAAVAHSVNPAASAFESQRINISDFYNPVMPLHSGKSFRRCEFYGPGAIVIMTGSSVRNGRWIWCDLVAVDKATIRTAAGFEHSTFEDCKFVNLTLFLPKGMVEQFLKENVNKAKEPVEIIGYNA